MNIGRHDALSSGEVGSTRTVERQRRKEDSLSITSSSTDAAVALYSSSSRSSSSDASAVTPRSLFVSVLASSPWLQHKPAGLRSASLAHGLRLLLIESAPARDSLAGARYDSSLARLSSVRSDLSTLRANLTYYIRPIPNDTSAMTHPCLVVGAGWLVGWLVFNGTFSTKRLYHISCHRRVVC